tara:strand:- start:14028 stop:14630 length:603 start_codon:yes stop_codon:yes gene_type:complete
MNSSLIELANALDKLGFNKEADQVDHIIISNASSCEQLHRDMTLASREYEKQKGRLLLLDCENAGDNLKEVCEGAIKKNKALEEAFQKALDGFRSKCGTGTTGGAADCSSSVNAYNLMWKAHDQLITKHERECIAKANEDGYDHYACEELQGEIDRKNDERRKALVRARSACGCRNPDGRQQCVGFEDGGRFRLPGLERQ